jgi:flavin-binding protein dodecin
LPFFWSPLPVPSAYWRHLEAYDLIIVNDTAASTASGTSWTTLVNISARGILQGIVNNLDWANVDYRVSIDGGAYTTFTINMEQNFSMMIGFETTLVITHLRTSSHGVDSDAIYITEK